MKLLAALLLLILAACGGGGGTRPDPPVPPPPVYRTDLLMAYYSDGCAADNADHANLCMTFAWASLAEAVPQLPTGRKAILAFNAYASTEAEMTATWASMKASGLDQRVAAIYPVDEPDVAGKSDAEVTAMNATLRRVFGAVPLAVIYGCDTGRRPGLSSYDWVGCDAYGAGCGVLTGAIAQLRAALGPAQRLMVIPGGASPWKQAPACFEAYAHANPIVVAMAVFLWQTVTDRGATYTGVRDNGMAPAYAAVGRKIMVP